MNSSMGATQVALRPLPFRSHIVGRSLAHHTHLNTYIRDVPRTQTNRTVNSLPCFIPKLFSQSLGPWRCRNLGCPKLLT